MIVAEIILAIELIALAVGLKLLFKSVIQDAALKNFGILVSVFIMLASVFLLATTTFYTLKNGRIAFPSNAQITKHMILKEQIKDKIKHEGEAKNDDSIYTKTGGACCID